MSSSAPLQSCSPLECLNELVGSMTTVATANPSRAMNEGYGHHHNHVAAENGNKNNTGKNGKPLDSTSSGHFKQLTQPPPTSMVLIASLQLLTGPLVPPHYVYLMTQQYLQNWINWAYHQPVAAPGEQERLKEVLRLAAIRLRLACPTRDTKYTNPGPINANELSMKGHPLLLRPDTAVLVQASAGSTATAEEAAVPSNLRRARSLPATGYLEAALAGKDGEASAEFRSCAVPEQFYEVRCFHPFVTVVDFYFAVFTQ